jgi:hypothetical protein
MTYKLRQKHYKYLTTVLYRFKTVRTVLADLRLQLEPLFRIEVTAFSNAEPLGVA